LQGYDYSQAGAYFVTIVAWQREMLFGEIVNGEMMLNAMGRIVESVWCRLPEHFTNINLDEYLIMPNHFHGIIVINAVFACRGDTVW
jgi:REP element-mobilizing transposase RayT